MALEQAVLFFNRDVERVDASNVWMQARLKRYGHRGSIWFLPLCPSAGRFLPKPRHDRRFSHVRPPVPAVACAKA